MGFFDSLFGGGKSNPSDAAMPYINQIFGQSAPYLQPYNNYGQATLPMLFGQYNDLLNNPGGKLNKIGEGYQQSPGFKFALDQALGASDRASAAGGMAGSPAHSQQNMEVANGIANQDYYNWLGKATGLFNQGLGGAQNMAGQGLQAGNSLANMIAQQLAQQGNYAYQGQQNQNQNRSDFWGNLGGIGGALGGYALGGPFGAFAGYNMFGKGH